MEDNSLFRNAPKYKNNSFYYSPSLLTYCLTSFFTRRKPVLVRFCWGHWEFWLTKLGQEGIVGKRRKREKNQDRGSGQTKNKNKHKHKNKNKNP